MSSANYLCGNCEEAAKDHVADSNILRCIWDVTIYDLKQCLYCQLGFNTIDDAIVQQYREDVFWIHGLCLRTFAYQIGYRTYANKDVAITLIQRYIDY